MPTFDFDLQDIEDDARTAAQKKYDDISCPVCGYYCLGNGGLGCIDKPLLSGLRKIPKRKTRAENKSLRSA